MSATIPSSSPEIGAFELNEEAYQWADEQLAQMSDEEKIGQLFMIAVWSEWQDKTLEKIYREAEQYQIGGVCFFAGPAERQANITNRMNGSAKLPLMIGVDGEWGLGMRVTDAHDFPYAMNVGAVRDSTLIAQMGEQIGKHCKRLGVHINFAPVHDLNSNPLNPVINYRSFGSGTDNVGQKCEAYIKGMQSEGVLAVAKHFPGHGDTRTDSHHALPVIPKSREEFERAEFIPFQHSIDNGLQALMIGHLSVPELVSHDLPASLNPEIIYGIVKQEMGFDGLIVSDALNMQAVARGYENHYLKAFLAGNDILLFPESLSEGIKQLKAGLANGDIVSSDLDERCRRVLAYKYALGVPKSKKISVEHLQKDLHPTETKVLHHQLLEKSITLVRNAQKGIPFTELEDKSIALLSINGSGVAMADQIEKYTAIRHIQSKVASQDEIDRLVLQLSEYDDVIVGLHGNQKTSGANYGISANDLDLVLRLADSVRVHLVVLANPYVLRELRADDFVKLRSLLFTYGDSEPLQRLVAQGLFGGIPFNGRLSLQINSVLTEGLGLKTDICRLGYLDVPEVVGLQSDVLSGIDEIVDELISEEMAPGCQILIARKGKVVWAKNYGYHTYAKKQAVQSDDIYDIASVTKIASTAPMVMQLKDEGALNLHTKLGTYLPELKATDKAKLNLKSLLLHQAGLHSHIAFDFELIDKDSLKGDLFSRRSSAEYSIKLTPWIYMTKNYTIKEGYLSSKEDSYYDTQVAEDVYTFSDLRQEMYHTIDTFPLRDNKEYKYSDLGFYYAARVVEKQTKQRIDSLASTRFHAPLGMTSTCYNPVGKILSKRIVPTVDEQFFRHQLLKGYVHDQGAALLGGVAGHAGLFSNANDLAKLLQMYLNGGFYGRENFILPQTVKYFTQHTENGYRRGVGFDKPETKPDRPQPTCVSAPPTAFGHTGFTGTGVWADPENELIYIFLSNRVHPYPYNNKYSKANIRPRIQQVIYDALME